MSYNLVLTTGFKKELKRLIKKYPSLRSEIEVLGGKLSEVPHTGISIGNNFFKIRLSIASKGKGKRGGARVITYVKIEKETVYLVSIYDKSEQESISDRELQERMENL